MMNCPARKPVADRRRYVGDMAHDVDHLADVGFQVGRNRDILAAAGDPA